MIADAVLELTQIRWEREELLSKKHEQGVNGGISEVVIPVNLVVFEFRDAEVTAGLRNIHLVTFHRRVVTMMAVVRNLPAEVWRPEERVRNLCTLPR